MNCRNYGYAKCYHFSASKLKIKISMKSCIQNGNVYTLGGRAQKKGQTWKSHKVINKKRKA